MDRAEILTVALIVAFFLVAARVKDSKTNRGLHLAAAAGFVGLGAWLLLRG